jgi:hypothetical protein
MLLRIKIFILKSKMKFIFPKNDNKYEWTNHCVRKMLFYGFSEARVRRVLKSPKRIEEGIAERTTAVMQPASTRRVGGKEVWSQEIWVMYQEKGKSEKGKTKNDGNGLTNIKKKIIISAWRYPGMTKPGKEIFVPEDTMLSLQQ